MIRRYSSAPDFKQALEDRLRRDAAGPEIQRRRQLIVFHRLLARLASGFGRSVMLKSGLCLEIRIDGYREVLTLSRVALNRMPKAPAATRTAPAIIAPWIGER